MKIILFRTMKYFFTVVSLIFAIFLLSCNNDSNPLIYVEKQKGIIPLHVGNAWEYTITLYDSIGNVENISTEYRQIISDTLIEGERWYKANFIGYYIANRSDGVWQRNRRFPYISESRELDDPYLRIPFPIELNESITINSETYTLLDKNIEVTVPAGTFSCYLYRLNIPVFGGVNEYFLYYSPGIGLVKERWDIDYDPSPYPIISYYAGEWTLSKFQVH